VQPRRGREGAPAQEAQQQRAAFAALYLRYRDRVFRYVRSRTPTDEDAADLTQQIFVQALDRLHRFQPQRGLFAAWLFTIARNTLADHHRRRRVLVAWDLLPESLQPVLPQTPEAAIVRREDLARLRSAIQALNAQKRELLILRFVAVLTTREIAAVLGTSEVAIRQRLVRTLQTLATQFDDISKESTP
jgi:RNA polymerase sigma-70 factor (ECF subfamily)